MKRRNLTDQQARAIALVACADEIWASIGGSEHPLALVIEAGGNDGLDLFRVTKFMEEIQQSLRDRAAAIEERIRCTV